MATLVTPINLQKIEFNVATAEGDSRVTTVTGKIPVVVSAVVDAAGAPSSVRDSFKVLLDPSLTPGQFRRATATASLAGTNLSAQAATWAVLDAQATLDDEEGRVQLVVDVEVFASGGAGTSAQIVGLMFQVTTLAKV